MQEGAEKEFLADILAGTSNIAYDSPHGVPTIHSIEELECYLPAMCEDIHKILGSQNLKATYQRCLEMDLREAGLVVLSEVEVPITWRGKRVSTRHADVIVRTPDGDQAVLKLEAVGDPLGEKNLQELEHYMRHFTIKYGFLVNFPHDAGFPEVNFVDIWDPLSENLLTYSLRATELCGGPIQSDGTRSKGCWNANTKVQVIKAEYVPVEETCNHRSWCGIARQVCACQGFHERGTGVPRS